MEKTLHEKLVYIQSHLNVPKGQFNSFGNYKYRSCEDILEEVKPLLKETGTTILIGDEMVNVGERYFIKATAVFSDGKDSIHTEAYAREPQTKKGMDEAQITGATSSYARKYALNGLFCIDDTKDADYTNKHGKSDKVAENNEANKSNENEFKQEVIKKGKKKFKTGDEFKSWRIENGLAENLSGQKDYELIRILNKLNEIEDIKK